MNIISKAFTKAFIEQDTTDSTVLYKKELGKIIDVSITDIFPNPSQPRKHFNNDNLNSLAKSISQDGIIQPLSIRQTEKGFELISGERRLRAAKLAGLKSVPCIILNADEKKSGIIALIENIQRSDLDFFEQASAISDICEEYNMTQEEISLRLGFSQSTIANKLRLLKLTDYQKKIICENNLTERHARAILKIQDEHQRNDILQKIVENNWNVNQTEKYIQQLEEEKNKKSSYKKRAVMLRDVRLFFNTVNKAVDVIKLAGIDAQTKRIDHDDFIEYIIKIPNDKNK